MIPKEQQFKTQVVYKSSPHNSHTEWTQLQSNIEQNGGFTRSSIKGPWHRQSLNRVSVCNERLTQKIEALR